MDAWLLQSCRFAADGWTVSACKAEGGAWQIWSGSSDIDKQAQVQSDDEDTIDDAGNDGDDDGLRAEIPPAPPPPLPPPLHQAGIDIVEPASPPAAPEFSLAAALPAQALHTIVRNVTEGKGARSAD